MNKISKKFIGRISPVDYTLFMKKIFSAFFFYLFPLTFFLIPSLLYAHMLQKSTSEVNIQLPKVEWNIQVHLNDYNKTFEKADVESLKAYLTNRLRVILDHNDCTLQDLKFQKHEAEERVDMNVEFLCPDKSGNLEFSYFFFFGDNLHRHISKITDGLYSTSYTFSPDNTEYKLEGSLFWKTFVNFLKLGLEHILQGFDHILFVLSLVLGAISFRSLFWLVTSFTIAHSLSLALATFGIVNIPPHVIEPAIAGSILWVALWNLFTPQKAHTRGDIFITFFFGLIHGLGFSNALKEAQLFGKQLIMPLLSFNLGVEVGQFLIIALSFPILAFLIKKNTRLGSLFEKIALVGISCMAGYWLVQRLFFAQY